MKPIARSSGKSKVTPAPKSTAKSTGSEEIVPKAENPAVNHPVEIKREFPGLPKSRGAYCTVFRLSGGHETKIENIAHANMCEKAKGNEIVETLAFDSPEEYKLYKSSIKSPRGDILASSTSGRSGNFGCLSPEQKGILAKLASHRSNNEPKSHILCVYQHTIFSKAVVMMVDFRDKYGRQAWNVKPLDHVRLLQSMANVIGDTFKGRFTREIISNMEAVHKRDLERGPREVLKSSGTYDTYVILTHFVLPDLDPQVDTLEREGEYIKTVAHTTLSELITIMTSPLYWEFYHDLTKDMSENYRGIIFSPKKGLNYSDSLKRMQHYVNRLDSHWTNYIVESKLPLVQAVLSRYDGDTPKYIEDADLLEVPDTPKKENPDKASGCAAGFNPGSQANDTQPEQTDDEDETEYETAPEQPLESSEEELDKKPSAKPKKTTPKQQTLSKKKVITKKVARKRPATKDTGKPTPRKRATIAKHRK